MISVHSNVISIYVSRDEAKTLRQWGQSLKVKVKVNQSKDFFYFIYFLPKNEAIFYKNIKILK